MWLHFWAIARVDLRLSADEFYAITPKQLVAMLKRHRSRVESTEFLFGQLTSWIANTGFRTAEKPTSALDFMPSQWAKKAKAKAAAPKRIRMTKKRRQAIFEGLRATLGQVATVVK